MSYLQPRLLWVFMVATLVTVAILGALLPYDAWWAMPLGFGALLVAMTVTMKIIMDLLEDEIHDEAH